MRTEQEMICTSIVDIAKDVRVNLKNEFPNCKFSVVVEKYSMGRSLHVYLMEAPFEAFKGNRPEQYSQVNHYVLQQTGAMDASQLTPECFSTMKRACEIAQSWNYDHSDSQSDYFETNFYLHLNVGKWDRGFERKEATL